MRTLIWKELRENGKWAALAFLCLLLAEFYTLGQSQSPNTRNYDNVTLCSPAFLMVTAFGSAACGAALAIVQILPEQRRDQWAALLHRPVPRSTIFLGKATAGLLLYGAATLPAFVASVIYVALPGRFAAPFVPGLMLPGLSDLLMGPAFYFGAMLVCLHRGHWFGSRGAVALSLAGVLVVHVAGEMAFGLPIGAGLVYFAGCWGAFLSNGPARHQPWACQAARLLIIFVGGELALLLILLGLQLLTAKNEWGQNSQFYITPEGQVLIETNDAQGSEVLTDLQGHPVTDPRYAGNRGSQRLIMPYPFAWLGPAFHYSWGRSAQNYVQLQREYEEKEVWYLLVKEKYFVGYDSVNRRKIGISDVDGFKPATARPRPFLRPLQSGVWSTDVFWCGPRLMKYDFVKDTVLNLTLPTDDVHGAMSLEPGFPLTNDTGTPNLAVALEDDIQVYAPSGTLLATLPYPHDPRIWPSLSLAENKTADRYYLVSEAVNWFESAPSGVVPPKYLDVYDAHGAPVASYSHSDPPPVARPESWNARALALTAPFLPVVVGTSYAQLVHKPADITVTDFGGVSIPHPPNTADLTDLILLTVLTVILSVATWVWARRAGFASRPARGWALLVLALGVPGLLTFWLAADWPVRVKCPHCGRRRRIDSLTCEHCHEPWLPPVQSGAEIVVEAVR